MKNVASTIQSYRNAVEIDPKDFRAWYGLGQTYVLQGMNQQALYYFGRTVISRPKDARIANLCKDKEGIVIHQLVKLYDAVGKKLNEHFKKVQREKMKNKQLIKKSLKLYCIQPDLTQKKVIKKELYKWQRDFLILMDQKEMKLIQL
ncbi:unnamed protein product [Paramecium sonneborni]|uniref:Tetratricopeptide repeat protein n=1 Tax=Paramecium sonneborni TaxID=65129 RepID=A0A8S1PX65_9CILI|nr:unnamed protein product [Paramecium sonneborni]